MKYTYYKLLAFLTVAVCLCSAASRALAGQFVHQLFSSHMVLQRDAADPVWGWTTPGNTVTVKVYDQNALLIQTRTALADSAGRWQVAVGPFGLVANNAAYSLTISAPGETAVTFTDVLIGDVWLCSGQSNMQWVLSGDFNAAAEIADSINYPKVRHFTVPTVASHALETNLPGGSWLVANPANSGGFSAVAYIMAREIYKQQGIPVGIILSAWGGTLINAWGEPGFVSGIADYTQRTFDQAAQPAHQDFASCLYGAMIYPLAPFKIKAVNWYQGEFDAGTATQYGRMLPGLMSSWRTLFGQPDLPFIIIQLPNASPSEGSNWAELREAQAKTVAADPNSRIVVTLDVGGGDLHPRDKQDMGLRAAWAAANLVYGNSIIDQSPNFTGFTVSGTNVICTFSNLGGGLMVGAPKNYTNPITPTQPLVGGTLTGFSLSGANKVFYNANAFITSSNTVVVSSPNVVSPVAVRYAWLTYPTCNLYNEITNGGGTIVDGLPAGSFRSDPVNKLNVNNGSGTGNYGLGVQAAITANGNPAGQVFDHWLGDTNLVANIRSASTTVTISQPYISVLAAYRLTGFPSSLTATPQSKQIKLTWGSITSAHYNVKRSTVSGGPYTTLAASLYATNSFVDTNVTDGITYYYVISANNILGEGPNSPPVNAVATGNSVFSRAGWTASASASAVGSPPASAIDGNITTRWSTGAAQTPGQWFQMDMGSARTFYRIVLDAGASTGGFPQGYQVTLSNDGVNWGSPVSSGVGAVVTTITFPAQTARYIRITQTGSSSTWWGIHECYVYATATTPTNLTATAGNSTVSLSWASALGATSYNVKRSSASGGPYTIISSTAGTNYFDVIGFNGTTFHYVVASMNDGGESSPSTQVSATPSGSIALNRAGWVATASASAGGQPPANAIDGDPGTRWSTGTSQANGQWFQIDLGAAKTFSQLVLDTTASAGDYPRGYQVYVSNDGVNWGSPLASGSGNSAITRITFTARTARYIRVVQTGSNSGWWSIHEFNVFGGAAAPSGGLNFNSIDLLPDNQLQLAWTNPVALVCYTSNLTLPIAWTVLTNSPVMSNNEIMLTLPIDEGTQRYFKLQ